MACIAKLAGPIEYDCDYGSTGFVDALIINKSDIVSYSINPANGSVSDLTLASGAKAYKITTVKRTLVVTTSFKQNEGAPNAYAHTVTLTHTGVLTAIGNAFSNGSFVVIARPAKGTGPSVYGLYYGLSTTAVDSSSHENGRFFTITMSTPENVIGEDELFIYEAAYDALYAEAV